MHKVESKKYCKNYTKTRGSNIVQILYEIVPFLLFLVRACLAVSVLKQHETTTASPKLSKGQLEHNGPRLKKSNMLIISVT